MARRPSQDVNLNAIAKRLNLAISTVSRAMRNAEGVHRPDTRTRVLDAAKVMGYDFSKRDAAEFGGHPHYIMALAQCSSPQSDQRYLTGMSRASVTLNLAILSHHATAEECPSVLDPKYQPAALKAGLVEGTGLDSSLAAGDRGATQPEISDGIDHPSLRRTRRSTMSALTTVRASRF